MLLLSWLMCGHMGMRLCSDQVRRCDDCAVVWLHGPFALHLVVNWCTRPSGVTTLETWHYTQLHFDLICCLHLIDVLSRNSNQNTNLKRDRKRHCTSSWWVCTRRLFPLHSCSQYNKIGYCKAYVIGHCRVMSCSFFFFFFFLMDSVSKATAWTQYRNSNES